VRQIEPKYDTLGDLWSVNLQAINVFKKYERKHIESGLELPKYDIQGFFSLMLQDGVLPVVLLHDELDNSFGFFCSNFKHPSVDNLELTVDAGLLVCPARPGVDMATKVGSISFTAPTFQQLFLDEDKIYLRFERRHSSTMAFDMVS